MKQTRRNCKAKRLDEGGKMKSSKITQHVLARNGKRVFVCASIFVCFFLLCFISSVTLVIFTQNLVHQRIVVHTMCTCTIYQYLTTVYGYCGDVLNMKQLVTIFVSVEYTTIQFSAAYRLYAFRLRTHNCIWIAMSKQTTSSK